MRYNPYEEAGMWNNLYKLILVAAAVCVVITFLLIVIITGAFMHAGNETLNEMVKREQQEQQSKQTQPANPFVPIGQ